MRTARPKLTLSVLPKSGGNTPVTCRCVEILLERQTILVVLELGHGRLPFYAVGILA